MVKVIIIEGTPEEVIETANGMNIEAAAGPASPPAAPSVDVQDDEKVFAPVDLTRRMIYRRPMSAEQKTVFRVLGEAHPSWVPAATLQAATNYSPAQFAGLMGAFGRRFSHTEGWVEGMWLFDAEWDYEKGAYNYRLPDTVLEAAKREKLV